MPKFLTYKYLIKALNGYIIKFYGFQPMKNDYFVV